MSFEISKENRKDLAEVLGQKKPASREQLLAHIGDAVKKSFETLEVPAKPVPETAP